MSIDFEQDKTKDADNAGELFNTDCNLWRINKRSRGAAKKIKTKGRTDKFN